MAEVAQFPAGMVPEELASPWSEEQNLLAAVRAGDRGAAEEIVERTYNAIYASLFRLCGDRDLAADLTQETYQKAWGALPRFDGRSQLFTWLYRIAYTTFLNHIRRPRRLTPLEDEQADVLRDDAPSIEQTLADAEESERLRRAVLELPDDLRLTVTAHFWGGLSVKEIAAMEGITTVAIRKRLHKAFGILEGMLEEDLP